VEWWLGDFLSKHFFRTYKRHKFLTLCVLIFGIPPKKANFGFIHVIFQDLQKPEFLTLHAKSRSMWWEVNAQLIVFFIFYIFPEKYAKFNFV